MTFQLSAQLNADANCAFELYRKYLKRFRNELPQSALTLFANPDWHGGFASKSPHDAELADVRIVAPGTTSCSVELSLAKAALGLKIFIQYSGVHDLQIQHSEATEKPMEWRYEQFRHVDVYSRFGKREKKLFTHDIEFVDGTIWSITAANIEVNWKQSPM